MNSRVNATCLTALGLFVAGCGPAPEAAKKDLAKVTVAAVQVKPLDDVEYFNGRTDAVESVEIRARVTGYLKEVKFKAGEEVTQGKTLYLIDPAPYQAEYDKADAEEKQTETLLKDVLNPKYDRAKKLRSTNAISAEDFEKIAGDRLQAASALTAAKKTKERLKLNLDWCEVKAPIDGKLSNTKVTEGNLVSADTTVLTTMVSMHPMYCYFDVDENTLLAVQRRVRDGSFKSFKEAKVKVYMGLTSDRKTAGQSYPFEGYLDFTDNRVDPATGTLKARAVFENAPVNGSRILTAGLYASIKVPLGKRDKALWIYDKSIVTEQGKKFVYVVNDKNIVEARPVYLLKLEDGMRALDPVKVVRVKETSWRPAAEGEKGEDSLKAGERVIVSGVQRVRPGVEVIAEDLAKEKKNAKSP